MCLHPDVGVSLRTIPGDLHKYVAPRPQATTPSPVLLRATRRRWPSEDGQPRPDVFRGDGSYLMMAQELVTAVQERIELIVVLVQNHGFHSIGELSESLGSQRFGTWYRYRNAASSRLDGDVLPVDLAANAESLGVRVLRANGITEFRKALQDAKHHEGGPVLVAPWRPIRSSLSWTASPGGTCLFQRGFPELDTTQQRAASTTNTSPSSGTYL